jgi:hypothetical protein
LTRWIFETKKNDESLCEKLDESQNFSTWANVKKQARTIAQNDKVANM